MAKDKTVTIRIRQGLGVLAPDLDNPGELKHIGPVDENGDPTTHDVPAAFALGVVADGRADFAGNSEGLTTTELALETRDDVPQSRTPRSTRSR